MREHRRGDAEAFVEPHVFAGVGEVILTPDDVRDLHRDVVDNVHKVKHRVSVGTKDDEVFVLGPFHPAANPVVDDNRRRLHFLHFLFAMIIEHLVALAEQSEPDGAVLFVGPAGS